MGAMSMMAKETGVTVFLINLGYDMYLQWTNIKKYVVDLENGKIKYKLHPRDLSSIRRWLNVYFILTIKVGHMIFTVSKNPDAPYCCHQICSAVKVRSTKFKIEI